MTDRAVIGNSSKETEVGTVHASKKIYTQLSQQRTLRAYEIFTQYYDPHDANEKLDVLYREGTAKTIIKIHDTNDVICF